MSADGSCCGASGRVPAAGKQAATGSTTGADADAANATPLDAAALDAAALDTAAPSGIGPDATGHDAGAPSPGYHETKAAYLRRLRLIEGQVRGLQRMVEEDTYCIDVLTQVAATTRALQSVATALVDDHIHHCVHHAAASGDPDVLEQKMDEVMTAVKRLLK